MLEGLARKVVLAMWLSIGCAGAHRQNVSGPPAAMMLGLAHPSQASEASSRMRRRPKRSEAHGTSVGALVPPPQPPRDETARLESPPAAERWERSRPTERTDEPRGVRPDPSPVW